MEVIWIEIICVTIGGLFLGSGIIMLILEIYDRVKTSNKLKR